MNADDLPDMDQTALAVATMTGIKQQFITAGWSADGAEAMTISMLNKSRS